MEASNTRYEILHYAADLETGFLIEYMRLWLRLVCTGLFRDLFQGQLNQFKTILRVSHMSEPVFEGSNISVYSSRSRKTT
jgi:hypothetical protein